MGYTLLLPSWCTYGLSAPYSLFGGLFYKMVNIFGSVPLLVVCFWLPALIGPLAGVVAYLMVRRYTNGYGAAVAGILMTTAPYYFIRTVPGWYDTDMFNLIFPLLVVWFFTEAVRGKIIGLNGLYNFSLIFNGVICLCLEWLAVHVLFTGHFLHYLSNRA